MAPPPRRLGRPVDFNVRQHVDREVYSDDITFDRVQSNANARLSHVASRRVEAGGGDNGNCVASRRRKRRRGARARFLFFLNRRAADATPASFAPPGRSRPSAIHSLGDAVTPARSRGGTADEARLTSAERMEARMRGRVRVAAAGAGDGDGDRDGDEFSSSPVPSRTREGGARGRRWGRGKPGDAPFASRRASRSFFGTFSPGSPGSESERRGAFRRRKRRRSSLRTRPRGPLRPREAGTEASSPRVRRALSPAAASRVSRGRAGRTEEPDASLASPSRREPRRVFADSRSASSSTQDFEALVVCAIFCNCVSLALYRPLEEPSSQWNEEPWTRSSFR